MWLSTRGLAPDSDDKSPCRLWTEWVSKFGRGNFAAGKDESPSGLRTVDQRFNPIVAGPFVVNALDEVWEQFPELEAALREIV